MATATKAANKHLILAGVPLGKSMAPSSLTRGTEARPTDDASTDHAGNNRRELEHDAIASLAYSYWLARGGHGEGSADDDWFRAERELKEREAHSD